MGWLGRVVVVFIGAGRVVVVLIGTSQSLSLRFASRACCVYNIDPTWPPSLRHSIGLSLSHWFDVGSSALCCVSCLGRVVGSSTVVLHGLAGLHCRGVVWNKSTSPLTVLYTHAPPTSLSCQIACNLARAKLICCMFAAMTAQKSPVFVFF